MRKGFTLIELMVIIVILGIVFSLLGAGCGGCTGGIIVEGTVDEVSNLSRTSGISFFSDSDVSPYSFAVSLQTDDGEIITFSSEDRQWSVVKKGDKVQAKIYKYTVLSFGKAGTYHNGRLLKRYR